MKFFRTVIILQLLIAISPCVKGERWQSKMVEVVSDTDLKYNRDESGFVLPDFSHAGYCGGGVPIPIVKNVMEISPLYGDNTAHIQNAIDSVAAMPADSKGMRGALLLKKGYYTVSGQIRLHGNGVVLRGEGYGDNPATSTIILATGNTPARRTVITIGAGIGYELSSHTSNKQFITNELVAVGSTQFDVQDASAYKVGDRIAICHPCTQQWLDALGGGGSPTGKWPLGRFPIQFHRRITNIEGNMISVDVPFYSNFRKSLSDSYIYKFDDSPFEKNLGIENLRVDIQTDLGFDEQHAWNAVGFDTAEDCWAKNVVALHFGQAGFCTQSSSRITIENCKAIEPVAIITGGAFYNFNIFTFSQQILFVDCYAARGRHNYISNGTTTAVGCVFLRCVSEGVIATNESHRHWSTGLLYDNFRELAPARPVVLGLYNRGSFGTNHGWAAAHSVLWNCDASANGVIIVQQPPTAQNYLIGGRGVDGSKSWRFAGASGYIEGLNKPDIYPVSLYDAQLACRRAKENK